MLIIMQLTPQLLKAALATSLNELLESIRSEFMSSKEWQETEQLAYPSEEPAVKAKKARNKGDPAKRAAATAAREAQAGVVAQPDGRVGR